MKRNNSARANWRFLAPHHGLTAGCQRQGNSPEDSIAPTPNRARQCKVVIAMVIAMVTAMITAMITAMGAALLPLVLELFRTDLQPEFFFEDVRTLDVLGLLLAIGRRPSVAHCHSHRRHVLQPRLPRAKGSSWISRLACFSRTWSGRTTSCSCAPKSSIDAELVTSWEIASEMVAHPGRHPDASQRSANPTTPPAMNEA